jgi:hypothetical protein
VLFLACFTAHRVTLFSMRFLSVSVIIFALVGLIGADRAMAGRYPRDFSGDAMQRHDSRLPSSPMIRFPGTLGMTYWPFIAYPPAPTMPVFNFVIEIPEESTPTPPLQTKPAPAKFWIARCGGFVEIDVAKSNLLEEERKGCPP